MQKIHVVATTDELSCEIKTYLFANKKAAQAKLNECYNKTRDFLKSFGKYEIIDKEKKANCYSLTDASQNVYYGRITEETVTS